MDLQVWVFIRRLLLLTGLLSSVAAFSQETLVEEEATYAGTGTVMTPGWHRQLNLALGVNATSQKDVVGSQDGASTVWNAKIDGTTVWLSGGSEWRNELLASLTMSRTPLLPDYFKTDDLFRVSSLYLWHLPGMEAIGPFARVAANTQMLAGHDVRSNDVTYLVASENGESPPEVKVGDRLQLTDPFSPLVLKESAGFFYHPYRIEAVAIEVLLGAGARQTFAVGQLAVSDDEATEEIEVVHLESQDELGADGRLAVSGTPLPRVSYQVEAEMFVPFQRSNENESDKEKKAFEKRSWELLLNVSFKMLDWVSLEYVHRLERNYAVSEKVQRSNNLLFSLSYLFGENLQDAPAECPPAG